MTRPEDIIELGYSGVQEREAIAALITERDRYHDQRDKWSDAAMRYKAERDRLREALREIERVQSSFDEGRVMRSVAYAALSASPPEQETA